jgi:hypothetical protein
VTKRIDPLYQTCYKKLFHFARAIVRTNELAEEAVERCFYQIMVPEKFNLRDPGPEYLFVYCCKKMQA